MVAGLVTHCQYLIILLIRSFERRQRIRMGESEVEEIEGFGQRVMGLIRLWNGVEKLERARFAGPTPGGSPPTIAADEASD